MVFVMIVMMIHCKTCTYNKATYTQNINIIYSVSFILLLSNVVLAIISKHSTDTSMSTGVNYDEIKKYYKFLIY